MDEEAFTEGPGWGFSPEAIVEVEGPEFLTCMGVEAGDTAVGIEVVEAAFAVGAGGSGAGVGMMPGVAVGSLPGDLAGEVQGEDMEGVVDIAGDVDVVLNDDGGGVAVTEAGGGPEAYGAIGGPGLEEVGFGGDAVTAGASPLGPVGFGGGYGGDLGGGLE